MAKAAEIVGGADRLKATFEWAKSNLPADQRAKLVADLQGPNGELVLRGLHLQASAAGNMPPVTTAVDTSLGEGAMAPAANANIQPFTDPQEQQAALSDPRYKTDPAYRLIVMKRIGAASGIDPTRYDAIA
jgi:hypothetical protein